MKGQDLQLDTESEKKQLLSSSCGRSHSRLEPDWFWLTIISFSLTMSSNNENKFQNAGRNEELLLAL